MHRALAVAVGRWLGRSGTSRFGGLQGRQATRGGDGPQGRSPGGKRQRAAPQARRREGLEPNGRDSKDGTGRRPESPAAHCADTPRPFNARSKTTYRCDLSQNHIAAPMASHRGTISTAPNRLRGLAPSARIHSSARRRHGTSTSDGSNLTGSAHETENRTLRHSRACTPL